ncbi:hypothetical protein H072_2510 [Dactylellina haptotyla CBS 200.50]|uniref:RING-type E3 ubiquitin transferase n=1 Tax=Dactylellina haptotyla (strain CBS 200.50) TaxID=1284197 RepID=S8AQW1_DACHA|nr:hypothetical protein H072_2510 [Dactylellina haptotyla CBS 200.50]
MSGRTGMPPRQPSQNSTTPQRRELVYCHQCQNEWYRDQHGLECPDCQSDFTEILENEASDPREDLRLDEFSDDDSDNEGFGHHSHGHHDEHHHAPSPNPSGFTLRMGGSTGPSISFRTVRTEFGGGSPHNPFGGGGGHVVGGLPNPRSPFQPSQFQPSQFQPPQFDHNMPSPAPQPQSQSPLPPDPNRRPGATPNFGNGGGPIAEMFTSIIQNIVGNNTNEQQNPRSPFFQPPPPPPQQQQHGPPGGMAGGGFPGAGFNGARSPTAGQNNPGQGSNQAEGPSPMGMPPNPFFPQMPTGRGGTTFYSSTRTWTGPNGEVRTVRTSSPMHHPGMQGPGEQQTLDLAEYDTSATSSNSEYQETANNPAIFSFLVSIIGANGQGGHHGGDDHGVPPFLRAFGLGHGPTGDYAWSQQDMDRILSQLMEQHQGNAPPPASEENIKNLPKVHVSQAEVDEGTECVICQDEYKVDEEVVKLPCKHIYHEECVKRWLETHDACPICRTPITPEEQRQRRPGPTGPSGGPQQPSSMGGGPGGAGASSSSGPNVHTTSGSGGGNGARWTWSASFGRG